MRKWFMFIILLIGLFSFVGCSSQDTFKIAFETNCNEKIQKVQIQKGEKIPTPKEISKQDHIFVGWYYNGDIWNFNINIPSSNMTLEAKWLSNQATIEIQGKSIVSIDETYTYKILKTQVDEDIKFEWSTSDSSVIQIDKETGEFKVLKEASVVSIYINIKGYENIKFEKKVTSNDGKTGPCPGLYPDLQGYTIKIASDTPEVIDPFNPNYNGNDKEAKQKAWKEVEKKYNCKIVVENYPVSAELGPSRWNYILTQAINKTSDYDFLYVPDSYIEKLVEGNALISTEDFYTLYGKNIMNEEHIKSGTINNKLYSLTDKGNELGISLIYNYDLFKELNKINPNLKEPAELFLNNEWTFEKFIQYCDEAKSAIYSLYGIGEYASINSPYVGSLAAYPHFLWSGLSSNDNEALLNRDTLELKFDTQNEVDTAEMIKFLFERRKIGNVVDDFYNQKSLFTVVDLSLDSSSYKQDFNVCYVPWPTSISIESIKPAVTSVNQYVMPIGKQYDETNYDCCPEFIYRAWAEVLTSTKQYNNAQNEVSLKINNLCSSEASLNSYKFINNKIESGNYVYDLFATTRNQYDNYELIYGVGYQNLALTVQGYIYSNDTKWEDIISDYILILKQKVEIKNIS